jgi:predicted ATPase
VIRQLDVVNFKRIKSGSFHMAPLTVLTGANGAGKSTLIQALLLVRQAATLRHGNTVLLNGPHGLELGEANEVLHQSADQPRIEVDVHVQGGASGYQWGFEVPLERRLHLQLVEAPTEPPDELTLAGSGFTYLAAERLGPRNLMEADPSAPAELTVGARGEFTAQVLHQFERQEVPASLRHQDTAGRATLRAQVELWTSTIVRPIEIRTSWPEGTNAIMLEFKNPGVRADWLRPANMGFGVSYALPILVAGLTARSGGLFLVENPEAHLHPEGQSRLGSFLALLAGSGVQVIVETHSDHVLNGIRRAVVLDRSIGHDDVAIHFFLAEGRDDGDIAREVHLTPSAALDEWPPGFFDQLERDLAVLARAQIRPR